MNLYQLEVREHAGDEDGESSGAWRSLPLYPADGATLELGSLGFRPGFYDIRVRLVPDEGTPSDWLYLDGIEVTGETEEVLPQAPEALRVDRSSCLVWDYPDRPRGLAGFLARYTLGDRRVWEEGIPIGPGVVDNPPLPTCGVPHGVVTFMVRAVDLEGNLSPEMAVLVLDRGPFDEALPVLDAKRADGGGDASTWPGLLDGIMVEDPPASGIQILRGNLSGLMWTDDARPLWSGDDARALWGVRYHDLYYSLSSSLAGAFVPEEVAPLEEGELLTVGFTATLLGKTAPAGGVRVDYRTHDAPLWSGNDDALLWSNNSRLLWRPVDDDSPLWGGVDADPLWDPDDATLLWEQAPWRPWSGKRERPLREWVDFRVFVPGGRQGPELRALSFSTSSEVPVPTVAEPQGLATAAGLASALAALPSTGGRLLKTTILTSGSGTFKRQAATTLLDVVELGGGGGGGGANANAPPAMLAAAAGGGAAGAYLRKLIANPDPSYPYSVGAGGTPGAGGPGAAGAAGGATTFGSLTAPGGGGGGGSLGVAVDGFVGGGVGGLATGGDVNGQGDPGGGGMVYGAATVAVGGKGGSSFCGAGGDQVNNGAGVAAAGRGAGGSGGGCLAPAAPSPGGAGSAGLIVVFEYS